MHRRWRRQCAGGPTARPTGVKSGAKCAPNATRPAKKPKSSGRLQKTVLYAIFLLLLYANFCINVCSCVADPKF